MSLKTGLEPRQSQTLALTPSLIQSLGLLRLPTAELLEEIRQRADENPFLEVIYPEASTVPLDETEPWLATPRGLTEVLKEQIAVMALPPRIIVLAQFLTGDLDENGFLQTDMAELASQISLTPAELHQAVGALQACDPPGIGARNLTECVRLQLGAKGLSSAETETVCAHLGLFAERDFAGLRRQAGLSRKRIDEILDLLQTLTPRPAEAFAEAERPIVPELAVERLAGGGFEIKVNSAFIPDIRLDQSLLDQLDPADPLRQTHLETAETLIRGIRYRGKTLCRIAEAIVLHQHRFFEDGPDHMAPLTRARLAQHLSLHPSTIGRAIAGKALGFDGLTYPLDQFLTASLTHRDGGAVSGWAAQRRIGRIIAAETPANPLSDAKIAEILRTEGVDISRRTVAKYRGCLNIPSSFKRRRRPSSP